MSQFALWIYVLITSLAVGEGRLPQWAMRYGEVAQAIATAAEEAPLPGPHGAERMAAVLVAIGYRESRYDPNARGDGGTSVGVWQVSRAWGPPKDDVEGQARLAARLVLTSWRVCAAQPLERRLAWYAAGGNGCERRHGTSRDRMRIASELLREHPLDVD